MIVAAAVLDGCAGLPPGSDFPKAASVALAHPAQTRLGAQFESQARAHGGRSEFRIISVGVDGFLTRVQMIDAAERTLDVQYFIFRGDQTGRLLTAALLRAADRGVRIRLLIDDGDTVDGDEQVFALDSHPQVEIRVFNPFAYRGHNRLLRSAEFLLNAPRLDYRMHNKLLVVDNSIAIIGGRNVGNQYFQVDPESQFADDDVFAAGPIAAQLSATFDEYWNSGLAIPARALAGGSPAVAGPTQRRLDDDGGQPQAMMMDGVDYAARIASGEPYAGLISGRLPLVWAHAQVVSDSPDKKQVENGALAGRLMARPVVDTAVAVRSELLMVTPYFIPADDEMQLLRSLRQRNVRVRILTNSLESTTELSAQSGYLHYRRPLLESGVELYELRALLGNTRGSGETARISHYGTYALHAKLFVFDRSKLFVGSMNFDQRSKRLNTEIGLIIDSPELAQQTAARFEAMAQPANSYMVELRARTAQGKPDMVWHTLENGTAVDFTTEPARSRWQRLKLAMLSWLPLAGEL
ncbi:MAG: phospholipase D family protein [Nevskia sp.]|nr:phospholipase D family protein [Nevskia sp.]